MVSSLHGNSNAELQDDKVISNFGDLALRPDIRPEILLRLSGKLQTTLDIHQVMEIFFTEMQPAVLVDGLQFTNDERQLKITFGKNSVHKASYKLQNQGVCLGELQFFRSSRFREHELANIEGLLTSLVYPLRNSLRHSDAIAAAFKDPLTGAGNRAALEKTLTREIELAKRHRHPLALLMLDFDHFKAINDKYGHSMGDQVLCQSVKIISQCIRRTDLCFRYGGEEFLLILTSSEQHSAVKVAERVQQGLSQLIINSPKGDIGVQASVGCAALREDDDYNSLITRVDEAMYSAKDHGRGSIIADDELLVDCR